jgi:hypothetical protein
MTGFVMRPRVLAPNEGELHDTFVACKDTRHSAYKYAHGGAPKHFPVPSVIGEVIIEDYRVSVVTPRQADLPPLQHWTECNEEGWIWCLKQWWYDD